MFMSLIMMCVCGEGLGMGGSLLCGRYVYVHMHVHEYAGICLMRKQVTTLDSHSLHSLASTNIYETHSVKKILIKLIIKY